MGLRGSLSVVYRFCSVARLVCGLALVALTVTPQAAGASVRAESHVPRGDIVFRLSGADRIDTGLKVSDAWNDDGAKAVVLTRSDGFADAMGGTPLAAAKGGPVLLTAPAGLDPRVRAEIDRVLAPGATVYLLGGTSALAPGIEQELKAGGYAVVRYSGETRYDTAVQIADQGLDNPSTLLITNGLDFPDALPAGAAAGAIGGAVLLSEGNTVPAPLQAYLAAHPRTTNFAVGGLAAAALPTATPIVGANRYETSVKVATTFFTDPEYVGLASGVIFPDALTGGADLAAGLPNFNTLGPMLLSPSAALDPSVMQYLATNHDAIVAGFIYGGTGALAAGIDLSLLRAIL